MENADLTVGAEFTASAATKSVIHANRGGTLALAIAMLENQNLLADYPFGDRSPDGTAKTGDAANFGIYKMNWYMLRQCPSAVAIIGNQLASIVWNTVGVTINSNPTLATQILLEAMRLWSVAAPDPSDPLAGNFWAGQRWGQSGLDNLPGVPWDDILDCYLAVQAIRGKCDGDPTVWTSTIRYWVDLQAV